MPETLYDVAIVGCGPVGALAANLLGRAGLSVLIVERETAPFPLPRAVHLDHEMMRLFQAAGVVDRVAGGMRDTQGHLHIGADRGVIRYLGTIGRPRPFGWANDYFFYQPELEAALRAAFATLPNVTLRLGTDFAGLRQDAQGVTLALSGGGDARARWVIACDGARSAVRAALGVTLDDLGFEEPWLVVDAEVDGDVRFPDLTGVPAGADLQQLSVMLCDPARPATIVPGRGNHRRWEFMLLPGEDDRAMMRPERVAALIAPYLDGVPHRITRAATYRFHGLIATRWQVGRVFLAGDAAHQTPPFFGQGMCHGLRDVANLAWKLALVARGDAAPALLDSYQPERDPHVRAVIASAIDAGRYICMLDPAAAAARDATMRARAAATGGHATAADLIPPIAGGIVAADTPGAGERFIQPFVDVDGRPTLLDEVTGGGARLFVRDAPAAPAQPPGIACIDASTLADGGAIAGWLDARAARAVLVRPDHYIFGTGSDPAALVARWIAAIGHAPHAQERGMTASDGAQAMKLRSIEMVVPGAADAAAFLTDVWGMAAAETRGHTHYLRGSGRFPYLVAVEEGAAPSVRSVTFVCGTAALAALERRVADSGLAATPVTSADPGGGHGLIVELPEGVLFRFLADTHEADPIVGRDLPVKLTHIVLNAADAEASADVAERVLGFRVSDRTKGMVFVRCNDAHHSTAFARAGYPSLNHIAFEMADIDAVFRGVGRLRDHRLAPAWGPGRHGPGANIFAYFIAPFGAVVEFSTAVQSVPDDYRTGTPDDWTWPEGRIDHWGLSDKDVDALQAAERRFRFARDWAPAPLAPRPL